MDLIIIAFLAFITVILFFYYLTTKKFHYWKKKNVPYLKPIPLFGNYADYILLKKSQAIASKELCRRFPEEPYFGSFFGTEPALVLQDPAIIKLVYTKDFYYFNSRELMDYTEQEVITSTMFFNYGEQWKYLRQQASTLFTTARLKNMFHLVEKSCHDFESMLDHETSLSNVVAARKIMTRYTMEAICACILGVEANTLGKNGENSPFTKMGDEIFGSSYYRGFKTVSRAMWPKIFYGLGLKSFPTVIDDFFEKLLTDVFVSRDYKPSSRNDFIDLMLAVKKQNSIDEDTSSNAKTGDLNTEKMVDKLIISQAIGFFGAGFETSASALSLTVYELAKNIPAQRRAQKEVDDYLLKHNNKIEYECWKELPFLEACVSEIHRLYPPLAIITREVVHDYTFPSGLQLEKGMRVHLPVFHLHRHEDLFPNPEQYIPERFLPDEGYTIKPYTYFPFGEGPRTCVGKRFSKMQVMSGLVTFFKKFSVELTEGTPEVLEFESTTILLQPTSNLPVKITRREGWQNRMFAK